MNRDTLRQQIIRHEGLELKPYRCTAGKLTIGVGRNIEDRGISEREAMFMLDEDIDIAAAELDKNIGWWRSQPEGVQHVLVDMYITLGWPRLSGFQKFLGGLKAGDYKAAASEMLNSRWAEQVGARAQNLASMVRLSSPSVG